MCNSAVADLLIITPAFPICFCLKIVLPASAAVFSCLSQGGNSKQNTLSDTVDTLEVGFSLSQKKHVRIVLMYCGFVRSTLILCLEQ